MPLLYSLLIVALALIAAADMHRRQKASGIRPNWTKTIVTGIGTVFISLCGVGVLAWELESRNAIVGLVLFVIIFVGGLVVFLTFVNRRWPSESDAR